MAKRHHDRTKRLIRPSNGTCRQQVTTQPIKKIDRVNEPVRQLKITLPSGTICTISEDEERYRYSGSFQHLWCDLLEGDMVKISHSGPKITSVDVDIHTEECIIADLDISADRIFMVLDNGKKSINFECSAKSRIPFMPSAYEQGMCVDVCFIGDRITHIV